MGEAVEAVAAKAVSRAQRVRQGVGLRHGGQVGEEAGIEDGHLADVGPERRAAGFDPGQRARIVQRGQAGAGSDRTLDRVVDQAGCGQRRAAVHDPVHAGPGGRAGETGAEVVERRAGVEVGALVTSADQRTGGDGRGAEGSQAHRGAAGIDGE